MTHYFNIMKSFGLLQLFITVFANEFNYVNKFYDGLYMCNTYCFTYNHDKLTLEKLFCDNYYYAFSIGNGWTSKPVNITNTSCNDLYKMSFYDKIYRYTNPPYIERFCNATNINCIVQCNPYKLDCTVGDTPTPPT